MDRCKSTYPGEEGGGRRETGSRWDDSRVGIVGVEIGDSKVIFTALRYGRCLCVWGPRNFVWVGSGSISGKQRHNGQLVS